MINIKNINISFKALLTQIGNEREKYLIKQSNRLLEDLANETPVDTGLARDSWKLDIGSGKAVISNDVEYIESLNNGHSKQAPSHFVESTALKYGKPVGAIVTVK